MCGVIPSLHPLLVLRNLTDPSLTINYPPPPPPPPTPLLATTSITHHSFAFLIADTLLHVRVGWPQPRENTMNSIPPNASSSGGKSVNSSSYSPLQQHHQSQSTPGFESSSRRSGSQSSQTIAVPRNNQAQKKLHKSTRKPRFPADDDTMAESVRWQIHYNEVWIGTDRSRLP